MSELVDLPPLNMKRTGGLREGCPSSPPLFNLYHAAVMTDFRQRRKRTAEDHNLEPGIPWKTIVDGKLKRRRNTYQAQRNSKVHIFGDLEFADDTATFATAPEFPHADHILETTFMDWGKKSIGQKRNLSFFNQKLFQTTLETPLKHNTRYDMSAESYHNREVNGRIRSIEVQMASEGQRKWPRLGAQAHTEVGAAPPK